MDSRPGQEASDGPNLFLDLVHSHPVRVEALGVVVQLEAINYGECQRLKLEFSSFFFTLTCRHASTYRPYEAREDKLKVQRWMLKESSFKSLILR